MFHGKTLSRGVKASTAFFFANVVTTGIAYLMTPIYTRLLSPDEYGQTSVFLTWLRVFGIVAMFCLSYGVFNNGMLDYPDKRDEYSFSMLILSNVITLAFSLLLLATFPLLQDVLSLDLPLLLLMCAIFLFQPAYNFWVSRQRYEMKYKFTVMWSVICAVASPAVAVACMLYSPGSRLYARLFGAEGILTLIHIGFYLYLGCRSRFRLNVSYWKGALLFNLPLIPHYLSSYLLGSSDKLMISRLIGDSATAYYSVAYSVASVATIVWSSANASLIPYTYENCKRKNYKAISNVTVPLLTMFASVSLLIILLAPEVVALMATRDYTEAIYVIPPVVGGVFFSVTYYIYANILYYYKKPKYVMYASVVATAANILLNYLFIPRYGYIAAGYTTLFCYALQAVFNYLGLRRVVREPIYNMKVIGALSAVVVIVSLVSNLLYGYRLIRYLFAASIVVALFLLRKRIFSTFFTVKRERGEPTEPRGAP